MSSKRKIEIFSAGCGICEETIQLVEKLACASCQVEVLDMQDKQVADRAKKLGVRSVPAVAIEGKLVSCCVGAGPDEESLKAAGLGQLL